MLNIIVISIIGILTIVTAFIAIRSKSLIVAIIASSVISLFASVIFILLASPDVAMTEAAIGSALTTIIFLYTLKKIKSQKVSDDSKGSIDD